MRLQPATDKLVSKCLSFKLFSVIALALLIGFPLRASAQADEPYQAAASGQDSTAELQSIRQRMEQQDRELRELREQISAMQSEVHPLPPLASETPGEISPFGVIQASAMEPADIYDLQVRMSKIENCFDELAAHQAANDDKAPADYEIGTDLRMRSNWRNGLVFESPNNDFRMHVGGALQFDINFFDNPPGIQAPPAVGGIGPQPNSLNFRRVRFRMDGTMYEVFDFFMMVDFDNLVTPAGTPNEQSPVTTSPAFAELYINWGQLPWVGNFRAGNLKEPIGFEHMESDVFLPFLERSYLQDYVFGPFNGGYAPGLEILDWREDLMGTYTLGVFGANNDQFGFSLGNDYAATTRITWLPIYDEPSDGAYLVHLGVAGSVRGADEGIVRIRTRGDIRSGPPGTLNPIYADTQYAGVIHATGEDILAGEFATVYGAFDMVAEYAATWIQDATIAGVGHGTPFFQGGYVQCGYFLTGEHELYERRRGTFDRMVPYENAYCVHAPEGECKGWGAWQVCARYNTLTLIDNGIDGGRLNSFTFGVNWYWNANARVQFNYDLTNRSAVKTTPEANVNSFGTRFSYDF